MRTTQFSGAEQAGDDYRDANTALFQQRRQLQDELDTFAVDDPEELSTRRRVRMLRRQLDDVTTQIVGLNMGRTCGDWGGPRRREARVGRPAKYRRRVPS